MAPEGLSQFCTPGYLTHDVRKLYTSFPYPYGPLWDAAEDHYGAAYDIERALEPSQPVS